MKIKYPIIHVIVSLFLPWLILNPISYSGLWLFSRYHSDFLHHKYWLAMGLFLGYHFIVQSTKKTNSKVLGGLIIGGIIGILWNVSGFIFPIWLAGISLIYLTLIKWCFDLNINSTLKASGWLAASFGIAALLCPFSTYLSFTSFFLIQNLMLIYLPQEESKHRVTHNRFYQNLNTVKQIIDQVKYS